MATNMSFGFNQVLTNLLGGTMATNASTQTAINTAVPGGFAANALTTNLLIFGTSGTSPLQFSYPNSNPISSVPILSQLLGFGVTG